MSGTAQRERPVWTWTCHLCVVSGEATTLDAADISYRQHYSAHHNEAEQAS